jgi:FHA domain
LLRIRDWNAGYIAGYVAAGPARRGTGTGGDGERDRPTGQRAEAQLANALGQYELPTPASIDLSGPPADPGVSHLHAVLIAEPDGGWAVLDPGSSNGTQVNGDDIPGGVKVPLRGGDRIHVGACTLLTILTG